MSAGLSFVVIYLKTMFGSDLISSMQFLSKTESDLLVLTQFSAHCEYPYYFFFDLEVNFFCDKLHTSGVN